MHEAMLMVWEALALGFKLPANYSKAYQKREEIARIGAHSD